VVLHHASLYAYSKPYATGPVTCNDMPDAAPMHVWAPGSGDLVLPDGVAVQVPSGTVSVIVQAHVLRFVQGPPGPASVTLSTLGTPPEHTAAWLPLVGSVPAIPPSATASSTTTCTPVAPMHIVAAWPHMHLLGTAFESAVVETDGGRTTFVDVPSWDFSRQSTYLVNTDVAAGERVAADCSWDNTTNQYVFAGLSTDSEMCVEGLIVTPASAAAWSGCQ
jgi:hypothetical protein